MNTPGDTSTSSLPPPQDPTRPRSGWWAGAWWKSTAALAVGVAVGIAILALVSLFARPLALLFLAVCIAAALSPLVDRLAKRLRRNRAILLIYGLLLVVVILLVVLFVPPLIAQLRDFTKRIPEFLDRARQFMEQYQISDAQFDSFSSSATQAGQSLIGLPLMIASGILDGILVVIVSLYLLLDAPQIRGFILSLFGGELRSRVDTVGVQMVRVAGGYVRGVAINMVLVATITTIGLTIIGVPFALILGIIAGLFEALPVIGSLIAAVPTVLIALLQSPGTALITLVFVLILQQIQGNVITPAVMKTQAEVPQFIVPLAVVAGGAVGGVVGALIAVPLVAVLRVLIERVVAPFIRQQTGAGLSPTA